MYHNRLIEKHVRFAFEHSKVLLLIGARQVGKSTLLKNMFPQFPSFLLDPLYDEFNLHTQADLFLKSFRPPIILDEVQSYPELLGAIKRFVDAKEEMGQYILTGSQNFSMLKQVSESMAGRVSILTLAPMTFLERDNIEGQHWIISYLNNAPLVGHLCLPPLKSSLFEMMWRGMMPGLIGKPDAFVRDFFNSYTQTYIERDVRLLLDIQNLSDFGRFIRLIASYSAQEINASELGREIGVANSTAILWKNTLIHSFLWHELEPYYNNTIKRLSKKPKGFVMDTGLLCYLNFIDSPRSLASHPRLGAVFETFVINMILAIVKASSFHCGFYHWRTGHGQEVDLVLEYQGKLFPIEIKCKTALSSSDCKGLMAFRKAYPDLEMAPGIIVYAGDTCRFLIDDIIAVPWQAIC